MPTACVHLEVVGLWRRRHRARGVHLAALLQGVLHIRSALESREQVSLRGPAAVPGDEEHMAQAERPTGVRYGAPCRTFAVAYAAQCSMVPHLPCDASRRPSCKLVPCTDKRHPAEVQMRQP